jgi:transposase-like protein
VAEPRTELPNYPNNNANSPNEIEWESWSWPGFVDTSDAQCECVGQEVFMGRKRRYSRELREEAVRQLAAGAGVVDLARDLGVPQSTVEYWRKGAGLPGSREQNGLSVADALELKQLRRENAQLRATQDFLKKAIAFFARASETDTP